LLEGGEGGKDRSTDPDRVLTFRWSNNFNLVVSKIKMSDVYFHGGGSESGDFFLHPVGDTGVHGGSTRL
jgi:hypothetical protein